MKRAIYSVGPDRNTPAGDIWRDPRTGNDYVKQSVVAFAGKVRVRARADSFFGGKESRSFRSRVLTNPTWGSLLRVLDRQIEATGDRHHVFLEGARVVGSDTSSSESVLLVELSLGS